MTPQELKNSILQMAIQGKLVEQRPEEGTGEELYRQIQKEKQELIRTGTIKKEKPLPEISEDEIPFDIPESWKWCRLSDIVILENGDRSSKYPVDTDYVEFGIPFFGAKDMVGQYMSFENVRYISETKFADLGNGKLKDNDFICLLRGSVGKTAIFRADAEHYTGFICAQMVIVRSINCEIVDFLYKIMTSSYYFGYVERKTTGTAVRQLPAKELGKLFVPFPPLSEQKRIVAKIEELLPYIDRYEKAWSRLEDFNKRFPVDMQKSILQMAIQGKLVEQRPEEGTGEELYQQIQAKKQKLIKEGKIKKEKPLPEISEDEIPFDIPESWMWVRMGDLAKLITKGSSPKWQGIRYVERGLLFVTSENVGVNALLLDNKKYVEERFTKLSPRSQLMKGDLLTNIVGASIGRTAVYDLDEPANINQAVCIIRLIDRELIRYILMYLNSTAAYNIMMSDKVDTARANISLTNICNFIVPLPPLAEQKRIVAKLEKILPLYERLK